MVSYPNTRAQARKNTAKLIMLKKKCKKCTVLLKRVHPSQAHPSQVPVNVLWTPRLRTGHSLIPRRLFSSSSPSQHCSNLSRSPRQDPNHQTVRSRLSQSGNSPLDLTHHYSNSNRQPYLLSTPRPGPSRRIHLKPSLQPGKKQHQGCHCVCGGCCLKDFQPTSPSYSVRSGSSTIKFEPRSPVKSESSASSWWSSPPCNGPWNWSSGSSSVNSNPSPDVSPPTQSQLSPSIPASPSTPNINGLMLIKQEYASPLAYTLPISTPISEEEIRRTIACMKRETVEDGEDSDNLEAV